MPRAARERLILDVAGRVFAGAGYHSASMDEIADRAGVSKPMVYAYFGSKEGLYLAYIDRTGKELVERLVGAAAGERTPAARVRAGISEFLAFVEAHRDGWRVLFSEVIASRPLEDEVAGVRRQITEAVRRMVRDSLPSPSAGSRSAASPSVGSGSEVSRAEESRAEASRAEASRPEASRSEASRSGAVDVATDGMAHAIVGAGESLANWWLEHPEVERDQVVEWYVAIVEAAVPATLRGPASRR